jgi:hypothetical protein
MNFSVAVVRFLAACGFIEWAFISANLQVVQSHSTKKSNRILKPIRDKSRGFSSDKFFVES